MYVEASRGDLDADTCFALLDSLCPFKLLILIYIIMGAGDVDVTVASTIFSVDTSLVVIYLTIEKPLIFFTNSLSGFGPFLSCILQMVTASGTGASLPMEYLQAS